MPNGVEIGVNTLGVSSNGAIMINNCKMAGDMEIGDKRNARRITNMWREWLWPILMIIIQYTASA